MPQATPELQAKFPGGDAEAWGVLRENFRDDCGMIRPKDPKYRPTTDREWEAINYLFHEWDYGYEEPTQ
jgi:hypothetical protein